MRALRQFSGRDERASDTQQVALKTEEAIKNGLDWLKNAQSSTGTWGGETTEVACCTYWALLALFGHGETPGSPQYGETVRRGTKWMLEKGREFDGRLSLRPRWDKNLMEPYTHCIGTAALAEYYSFTREPDALALLEKAVALIVEVQAPDGGWNEHFLKEPAAKSNLWTTGWAMQALRAAEIAGVKNAGTTLDKVMNYLKSVQFPDGGFGLLSRSNSAWTGIGAYGDALRPRSSLRVQGRALTELVAKNFQSYKGAIDLEIAYFNTLASLLQGGSVWNRWNRQLQPDLMAAQGAAGSWGVPPNGKSMLPVYSINSVDTVTLQRATTVAGETFRTSLCILMLEAPYRFQSSAR